MSVLKKILHWLAYPFVGIAFLWSMMRVKQKAKTYANQVYNTQDELSNEIEM